ncbi:MAG: hypothetical protein ACKO96_25845 [Flammeovirgaceae bacterium]
MLEIIGFCAHRETLDKIERCIETHRFISLKGGANLIPHNEVMNAIASANFGIVSYQLLPHLKSKMPTKLYEYLGAQLPILLQKNEPWTSLANQFNACIAIDFDSCNPTEILKEIHTKSYYGKNTEFLEHQILWSSEEKKLIDRLTMYSSI